MRAIAAPDAKAQLHMGGEIAFLDVREAGQFGEGHPLFAVPCPYSRLELTAPALVPNSHVPVILIDAGDTVAQRAAARLEDLGYSDVAYVAGGAPGWRAAGLTLFKGVNVPSKTLGELAEAVWHPATIDAAVLRGWRSEGKDFGFFDARPPAEYGKMHVPGAVCLPNGELAHRFAAAVADDDLPVLITCAGRTRGIVGAIGMRLAGIPNPVFALENGTQGWALAGETLERGAQADPFPALDEPAFQASRERARALCEERGIPWIDRAGLEVLQADEGRTTYLFDVRSAEEYRGGHLPGAIHAPSGQLAQAADQWIGTRHAQIVLADDTGLRAALAAFWLRQLGWECYVLADLAHSPPPLNSGVPEFSSRQSRSGEHPTLARGRAREGGQPQARSQLSRNELVLITPQDAAAGLADGGCCILDLRPSLAHRAAHPAGAHWSIRSLMGFPPSPALPRKGGGGTRTIVLLADEPAVAELAAIDLRELGHGDLMLLDGGFGAWLSAGLPVEASPDRPSPEEAIDFLAFVHDRHDGNLESSRRYLAWEQGLVAQLDDAERAEFRLERPPA